MNTKKGKRYLSEKERREDILEAARQVFGEKGYRNAGIEEIAKRAGVAHGTVYLYYPSKLALAMEIIGSRGASGFLESIKSYSSLDDDPAELLKTIANNYYGDLGTRIPLIRFSIAEAITNPDVGRKFYTLLLHRIYTDLGKLVGEYQKKALFKEGDTFIMGHVFHGMLFGFLYSQELMMGKECTQLDLKKIIPQVVDIFLHGVCVQSREPISKSNVRKTLTRNKELK